MGKSIYILVIFCFVFLISCRNVLIPDRKETNSLDGDKIYKSIIEKEFQYTTFSFKYSAKVKTKEGRYNFNGLLKIRKDSVIWISITPGFGIEMARIVMTPDSLRFLNRINSTYYEGDYSYFNSFMDIAIDYYTIQSILTNEFFIYPIRGKRQRNFARYKAALEKEFYSLQPEMLSDTSRNKMDKDLSKRIIQKLFIHPDLYKIFKISLNDSLTGRNLDVSFADYIDVMNNKFPQNLILKFNNRTDSVSVDINYNKITVDTDLKFHYRVPEKYTLIKK